jgi:hypothetical protein
LIFDWPEDNAAEEGQSLQRWSSLDLLGDKSSSMGGITVKHGKRLYLVVGLLLLSFGQYALADVPATDELPQIILSGLAAYKAEGPEAAVKAWIKGSPVEGSREALSQSNILRQVQDFYGPYKGFHVIRVRNLTPTTRVIYLVLDFEKGPLFTKFTAYRSEAGWILVNFNFNTKEEQVLPPCP